MKPTDPIIHEYISPDGSISYGLEFPISAATNLLKEPESDVRMKAIIAVVQGLMPQLDPDNRALVLEWAVSAVVRGSVEEKLSPLG